MLEVIPPVDLNHVIEIGRQNSSEAIKRCNSSLIADLGDGDSTVQLCKVKGVPILM